MLDCLLLDYQSVGKSDCQIVDCWIINLKNVFSSKTELLLGPEYDYKLLAKMNSDSKSQKEFRSKKPNQLGGGGSRRSPTPLWTWYFSAALTVVMQELNTVRLGKCYP